MQKPIELKDISESIGYWDYAFQSPCKTEEGNNVVRCNDDDAEFWSVYIHNINGLSYAIIDLPAKDLAVSMSFFINELADRYHETNI